MFPSHDPSVPPKTKISQNFICISVNLLGTPIDLYYIGYNVYINIEMIIKKLIVRLRMWYADVRGHHGKRWNYEPGEWYMGRHRKDK